MIIDFKSFEVVGLNGSLISETGISLPVGHKIGEDVYFKAGRSFMSDGFISSAYSRSEIEDYDTAGRLTLLPRAVPMMLHASMLYAERSLLDFADFISKDKPISSFEDTNLDWQQFPEDLEMTIETPQGELDNPTMYVVCAPNDVIEKIRDNWAKGLIDKSEEQFKAYFQSGNEDVDKRIKGSVFAEYARCAQDNDLRMKHHLLSSLLESDSKKKNIWEFGVNPELGVDFKTFSSELETLEQRLRA